jgi:nitrogen fixation-related uncharacterized protein
MIEIGPNLTEAIKAVAIAIGCIGVAWAFFWGVTKA